MGSPALRALHYWHGADQGYDLNSGRRTLGPKGKAISMFLIHWLFKENLSLLEKYGRSASGGVIQDQREFEVWLSSQAERLDPATRSRLLEYHSDEMQQLTDELPQILWRSIFVTAYAHCERYLFDVCDAVKARQALELSHKDLRHNGIHRAEAYLCKVAQIDSAENAIEWNTLKLFGRLRNKLLHADGVAEPTEQAVLQQITDPPLLEFRNNRIWFLEGFAGFALETMECLVKDLQRVVP